MVDALAGSTVTVRGITRNPNSAKAKALQASGVDVVEGDLGNKESLVKVRDAGLCPACADMNTSQIIALVAQC